MWVVTGREMQAIDRATIDGGHVPALVLMERAGRAVAAAALGRLQGTRDPRVLVLCGKGNNGGDGFVAARVLREHGARVEVHLSHDARSLSTEAHAMLHRLESTGVPVRAVPPDLVATDPIDDPRRRAGRALAGSRPETGDAATDHWTDMVTRADLCIDALLGTGVRDRLHAPLPSIIDWVNRASNWTLAVDLPSGVNADTGEICGTATWADQTITMGLPKLGLVVQPGAERAGRIGIADLGFPAEIVESTARAGATRWIDAAAARRFVPRLDPASHKYARGAVVVVAGSRTYPGAAVLAATAALRGGAGIVHLVVPAGIRAIVQGLRPELIVHAAPETPAGLLGTGFEAAVTPLLERARAVAIGPGIDSDAALRQAIEAFVARLALPAVLDADAIAALPPPPHRAPRIVTPHAGELARWTRLATGTGLERLETARRAARERQVVVLAKGAPTFTLAADGRTGVNATGNAGLATAGSGDVLTGIVAALLSRGCEAWEAAALAAHVHGRAAELAAERSSPRGTIASDLLDAIGLAHAELDRNPPPV